MAYWDADGSQAQPDGGMQADGYVAPTTMDEIRGAVDPYQGLIGAFTRLSDNILRVMAHGATAGGSQAIAAGTQAIQGDQSQAATMEGQRAMTQQAREQLGPVGSAVAETAGSIGTGMLLPADATSTLGRSLLTGGTMGGIGTAAQSYFDTGELPSLPEVAAGTIVGAAAAGAGYELGKLIQRPRLKYDQDQNVNLLTKEGIDVTSGQATADPKLMRVEARSNGAYEFVERQKAAFSRAAARRAGIQTDSGVIDSKTLNDAFDFVGQQMDGLAARNNISGPQGQNILNDMVRDASDVLARYRGTYNKSQISPAIPEAVRYLQNAAKKGVLTGPEYQRMSSQLFQLAQDNPSAASFARQMRSVVNDGMEKYITSTNQPDAGAWQMVNRRFRNLLVVEEAMGRSGTVGAGGMITPQALDQATKMVAGKRAYVRGRTDFDDLAKAGMAQMKPLPTGSYAPDNEIAKVIARKVGAGAAGGGLGYLAGVNPVTATLAGMAGEQVLGAAASRLRMIPVNSLARQSASLGGQLGASIGSGAAQNVNPFARAMGM